MEQIKDRFSFDQLPQTRAELEQLPEAALTGEAMTAALTVLAFSAYTKNREEGLAMLEFLSGPKGLSTYEKQFIADRLRGKEYVPASYIKGASPTNNYRPEKPYVIEVLQNPYSYTEEGYARLFIASAGADSPRPLTLRFQPSSGRWFLWEQSLLADIRVPKAQDPWA